MEIRIVKKPQERRIRAIPPAQVEEPALTTPAQAPNSRNSALSLFSQPYTPAGRESPVKRLKKPNAALALTKDASDELAAAPDLLACIDSIFPDVPPLPPSQVEQSVRRLKEPRGSWAAVRPIATWIITGIQLPAGDWIPELNDLENFFTLNPPPPQVIDLNGYTQIGDPDKFISSHLATCRAYNGKTSFLPYLERLRRLRDLTDTDPVPPLPRQSEKNDIIM
jgi:hypothetical protein